MKTTKLVMAWHNSRHFLCPRKTRASVPLVVPKPAAAVQLAARSSMPRAQCEEVFELSCPVLGVGSIACARVRLCSSLSGLPAARERGRLWRRACRGRIPKWSGRCGHPLAADVRARGHGLLRRVGRIAGALGEPSPRWNRAWRCSRPRGCCSLFLQGVCDRRRNSCARERHEALHGHLHSPHGRRPAVQVGGAEHLLVQKQLQQPGLARAVYAQDCPLHPAWHWPKRIDADATLPHRDAG
mmetsp:Transcript_82350/g.218509  ORF Transcript_82350/g.218509 Transcript_82350/m.218509 type:complete len:241 (+) Transcript_82350:199-921(+)